MSENSGGNSGLAFIVGALVVAVLGIGYYLYAGGGDGKADIKIDLTTDGDS